MTCLKLFYKGVAGSPYFITVMTARMNNPKGKVPLRGMGQVGRASGACHFLHFRSCNQVSYKIMLMDAYNSIEFLSIILSACGLSCYRPDSPS